MTEIGTAKVGVSASGLLAMMPHGLQFLFLDEILEVDKTHVVARYRFREDEFFYPGHFPERPITPGVILLEAMCQCGMVAQGLYLLAQETSIENASRYRFLFTSSEVEWSEQVSPGTAVIMRSSLLVWRMRRIRARVKMFRESGALVAESVVSGMGVLWEPEAPPSR